MYPDTLCPLLCGDEDTIEHILHCTVLKANHTSNTVTDTDSVRYDDIFVEDVRKQKQVTELYKQLLEIRTNQLNC